MRGQVSWDAEATVGDFILLRSSGVPVYNFCVAGESYTCGRLDERPPLVRILFLTASYSWYTYWYHYST